MKKVEIYTTPTCIYCSMTKEFFEKNNVEYTEYDVASDSERRKEVIEKSGQMGVPVILIDGQIIIGFNKVALAKALGL